MKNILLIGLGRFGKHVAYQLNELGHEVMAVDENENLVNEILPYVTDAQIGDSTNENFLESLGIKNYDICFVTIGGNFQNSLETTSLLKELGAKMVISRAERDVLKGAKDAQARDEQRGEHRGQHGGAGGRSTGKVPASQRSRRGHLSGKTDRQLGSDPLYGRSYP